MTNNTANSNYYYGICILDSDNNMLTDNTMSGNNYNFYVSGKNLSHYIQNIDTTNKVDGKPVYYWSDRQNQQVPNDAGLVGIVNSTNITVKDLTLTNNGQGVLFAYTKNSRIENVTASNSRWGVHLDSSSNNTLMNNTANSNYDGKKLWSSSNNTLTNNIIYNNTRSGIRLYSSSNNLIYNNRFDNTNNAFDNGNNQWNITKTVGTNIIGGPYLGGNYWSDYAGEDLDGDGIGDTPYDIPGGTNKDYLPLIKSAPSIFDTGAGTYPSIMGTHGGKIIASRDINHQREQIVHLPLCWNRWTHRVY